MQAALVLELYWCCHGLVDIEWESHFSIHGGTDWSQCDLVVWWGLALVSGCTLKEMDRGKGWIRRLCDYRFRWQLFSHLDKLLQIVWGLISESLRYIY